MSYQTDDKHRLIFFENLKRFSYISKADCIRENSLYQKHKTDKELLEQEEIIRKKELEHLRKRRITIECIKCRF